MPVETTLLPDGAPEPVEDPNRSLMCYRVRAARTPAQPKYVPVVGTFVNNPFGPEQVDTIKEEELCLPSELPGR